MLTSALIPAASSAPAQTSEPAPAPTTNPTRQAAWVEKMLPGMDTRGPYRICERFISAHSETLWVDQARQTPGQDYQINYALGEVTFARAVPATSQITARFLELPVRLQDIYRRRRVALAGDEPGPTPPQSSPEPPRAQPWSAQEPEGALNVAGGKTLGIRVGTDRDLSLEQTLQLSISGRIAPQVEVLAILSDQNIPIQPEGDTQTLRELDKVLMQVRSEHLSASLGDFDLSFGDTRFGRYERKLQGVLGEATFSPADIALGGALSEGRFHTLEIVPLEGNQGPYQLTSREGDTDIVVLAGTERVWVNGERLVRGANNDYTIEYGNGQITFTPRRLITDELRIVADYEYTIREYQRTVAAGRARLRLLGDSVTLGVTAIREADDAANPVDLVLSKEDDAAIQQAGDDPNAAWVSGARPAPVDDSGLPAGRYNLVTRDGVDFYEPDLSGRGAYDVSFSWVGGGAGDYVYAGGGIYRYSGPGQGQYAPRIPLPLPAAHHLTAFDLDVDLSKGLGLSAAAAVSDLDENTRSTLDDADNRGFAYELSAHYSTPGWRLLRRDLGRMHLKASLRDVGDRFHAFGRIEGVEENRRWGLSATAERTGERMAQASLRYEASPRSSVELEQGRLDMHAGFSSERQALSAVLEPQGLALAGLKGLPLPTIRYAGERIRAQQDAPQEAASTSEDITRHKADVAFSVWKLAPTAGYQSEESVRTAGVHRSGAGAYTWTAGGATMGLEDLALSYEFTLRKDDSLAPSRRDSLSSCTHQARIASRRWQAFSLSGQYTHRTRREARSGSRDRTNDLAQLDADYAPLAGAISAKGHYTQARTRIARQTDQFIEVGPGRGDYRREERDGVYEFVPDLDGSYMLYTESFGDLREVSDKAASLRLGLAPEKLGPGLGRRPRQHGWTPWISALGALSTDTVVEAQEQNGEGQVLRRKRAYTHDFHLFRRSPRGALRFRLQEDQTKDQAFAGSGYELLDRLQSARAQLRPGRKWHAELTWEHGIRSRQGEGPIAYDIAFQRLVGRVTYALSRPVQASTDLVWGHDRDREPAEAVSSVLRAIRPEIVYSFGTRGRVRLQGGWGHVTTNPQDAPLVYRMADGLPSGDSFRWDVQIDYRVGRYLTLLSSYTGRNEPGRHTTHLGKAEMRAYF